MYTQFQRFVATLLLFSILLQSCGNPNWKMVEPVSPAASGKKSQPSKAKKRAPANLLPVQEGSSGGSMALTIDLSPELDSASLAKCSTEGVAAVSSGAFDTSFPAAHGHGQLSTSPPTPLRGPSVPASNSAQASRPSSGSKKSSLHPANKPRHAVLGKASVANAKYHPHLRICPHCRLRVHHSHCHPLGVLRTRHRPI